MQPLRFPHTEGRNRPGGGHEGKRGHAGRSPPQTHGRSRRPRDADGGNVATGREPEHAPAIDQMIDKDVPCEEILIQINAVKGALHRVGQIVLEGHLQHCVRDGIEHGDADATIAAFAKAVEHFSRRS